MYKRQGLLSPRSHEDYLAYADPSGGRGLGRSGAGVSSRDVVLSGFYDSVGLYDAPAPGHAAVADAWVDRLGIGDLVSDEPGSFGRLSLGQQKLALLARALVKSPRLLVLDEPTQGLDQPAVASFYQLIEGVRDDLDCAVLMVSHDLHVVMRSSDHVICLNGHVCCQGTPTLVSAAPEYQALFGFDTKGALALYRHEHDHRHDHVEGSGSDAG